MHTISSVSQLGARMEIKWFFYGSPDTPGTSYSVVKEKASESSNFSAPLMIKNYPGSPARPGTINEKRWSLERLGTES